MSIDPAKMNQMFDQQKAQREQKALEAVAAMKPRVTGFVLQIGSDKDKRVRINSDFLPRVGDVIKTISPDGSELIDNKVKSVEFMIVANSEQGEPSQAMPFVFA